MTNQEITDLIKTVKVYEHDVQIPDSYKVSKKDFKTILRRLRKEYPENPVLNERGLYGMAWEWATHNFLYKLGIKRSSTKDVDLDYPRNIFVCLTYFYFIYY